MAQRFDLLNAGTRTLTSKPCCNIPPPLAKEIECIKCVKPLPPLSAVCEKLFLKGVCDVLT